MDVISPKIELYMCCLELDVEDYDVPLGPSLFDNIIFAIYYQEMEEMKTIWLYCERVLENIMQNLKNRTGEYKELIILLYISKIYGVRGSKKIHFIRKVVICFY